MPERPMTISPEEAERFLKEKKHADRKPIRTQKIEKAKKEAIIEVDLHIDQLLDTTAGMSNAEILDYQLQKFNEVMQENLHRKNQRIVFIHGKGEGILKNAILKELKSKYRKCYVQDASFQKYGYGATMVIIK
jgi:dsDNA-specific endonuclease/ATPase MutS2